MTLGSFLAEAQSLFSFPMAVAVAVAVAVLLLCFCFFCVFISRPLSSGGVVSRCVIGDDYDNFQRGAVAFVILRRIGDISVLPSK